MIKFLKISLFITFYLSSVSLTAQLTNYGSPIIKTYQPEEYKAAPENYSVVQHDEGIMYFANYGYILEYDGVYWRKIKVEGNKPVYSLAIDSLGTIYASAGNEFGALLPDTTGLLSYVSLSNMIDSADIYEENIGKVFANDSGIYYQTAHWIVHYPNLINTENINTIKPTIYAAEHYFTNSYSVNNKYFVHQNKIGLMQLYEGNLHPLKNGSKFIERNTVTMLPLGKKIIVCTEKDGLFYYTHGYGFGKFAIEANKMLDKIIILKAADLTNAYVIATINKGILIVEKEKTKWKRHIIEEYGREAGLPSEQITSIYNNPNYDERLIWMTSKYGISQTKILSPLRRMNAANDVKDVILDIRRFNEKLYVRTLGKIYVLKDTLEDLRFYAIGDLTTNNDWITMNVNYTNEKTKTVVKKKRFRKKYTRKKVKQIKRFTKKRIVTCSHKGIHIIENDTANLVDFDFYVITKNEEKQLTSINQGDKYDIQTIYQSKKHPHRLIIGLSNGAAIVSHQQEFWIDEGRMFKTKKSVTSIGEDKDGNIWLGIANGQLAKVQFKDTTLTHEFEVEKKRKINVDLTSEIDTIIFYSNKNGLPKILSNGIFEYNNNLLFSTINGLFHFNKQTNKFEKDQTFDLEEKNVRVQKFYKDQNNNYWLQTRRSFNIGIDFFKLNADSTFSHSNEINKFLPEMTLQTIFPDKDGFIWLSGTKGLFCYNSNAQKDTLKVFNTLIRKVNLGLDSTIYWGASYLSKNNFQVTHKQIKIPEIDFDHNDLRFEYAAPYFNQELETKYSYYLEGYDDEWSEWTTETKKEYTNLKYGNYIFQVKAQNIYGDISETAAYKFTILTPWYEKWWFYVAEVSLFILILLVSIILNRTQKASKLTAILTMVTVTAIFKLLAALVFGPIIGMFAKDIIFFKILMNTIIGALLLPVWSMTMKLIQHGSLKEEISAAAGNSSVPDNNNDIQIDGGNGGHD